MDVVVGFGDSQINVVIWVGLWSLLAAFVGAWAARKGRRAFPWYVYAWFLMPIACLHLLLVAPVQACPHCGAQVPAKASLCPKCSQPLEQTGDEMAG